MLKFYQGRKGRKVRCKSCGPCLAEECEVCANCLDKPKFGGHNKRKQACVNRKCVRLTPAILPKVTPKEATKVTIKIPISAARKKRRSRPAQLPCLPSAQPVTKETKFLIPIAEKSKKITKKRKANKPKFPKFKVTVNGICHFYNMVDYPLLVTDQLKERFQDFSSFENFYAPLLASVNPSSDPMRIKTFCRAKWREGLTSEVGVV